MNLNDFLLKYKVDNLSDNIKLRDKIIEVIQDAYHVLNLIPLTKEEFISIIDNRIQYYPKEYRKGQAVFNAIDEEFGVARDVQYTKNIDCFYDDSKVDDFINAAFDSYSRHI